VLRRVERVAKVDDLAKSRQKCAEDVTLGQKLVRLAIVRKLRLALHDGRTAIGVDFFRDNAKERRFSGAVRRDERGAVPHAEAEGDVLEKRVACVSKAQIGDLKEGHGPGGLS